jgi:hypothetical protein
MKCRIPVSSRSGDAVVSPGPLCPAQAKSHADGIIDFFVGDAVL